MLARADSAPSPEGEKLRARADRVFLDVLQLALPPLRPEGAGVLVCGGVVVYEMRVDDEDGACGDFVAIICDILG